jgi:predicted ATPase
MIVVDDIECRLDSPPDARGYTGQLVHWDLRDLRQHNQAEQATKLETNGANLANVFASLTRAEQQRLVETFSALVPAIADVGARLGTKGSRRLVFQDRWDPDVWFEPDEVSDGTILVLAYLTLAYQPRPANLLAIEAPERGLHPYLLDQMVKLLRRLTAGDLGAPPIQVVLATHSSEFLAYVQPEEVRFLTRDPATGAVRVEQAPTDSRDWVNAYREYNDSMGGMWLSGSLGGVPGAGR